MQQVATSRGSSQCGKTRPRCCVANMPARRTPPSEKVLQAYLDGVPCLSAKKVEGPAVLSWPSASIWTSTLASTKSKVLKYVYIYVYIIYGIYKYNRYVCVCDVPKSLKMYCTFGVRLLPNRGLISHPKRVPSKKDTSE